MQKKKTCEFENLSKVSSLVSNYKRTKVSREIAKFPYTSESVPKNVHLVDTKIKNYTIVACEQNPKEKDRYLN